MDDLDPMNLVQDMVLQIVSWLPVQTRRLINRDIKSKTVIPCLQLTHVETYGVDAIHTLLFKTKGVQLSFGPVGYDMTEQIPFYEVVAQSPSITHINFKEHSELSPSYVEEYLQPLILHRQAQTKLWDLDLTSKTNVNFDLKCIRPIISRLSGLSVDIPDFRLIHKCDMNEQFVSATGGPKFPLLNLGRLRICLWQQSKCAIFVARMLDLAPNLRALHLDIYQEEKGPMVDVGEISKALTRHTSLKQLTIQQNNKYATGNNKYTLAVACCKKLTAIDVDLKEQSHPQGEALLTLVSQASSLKRLRIDFGKSLITDIPASFLARLIRVIETNNLLLRHLSVRGAVYTGATPSLCQALLDLCKIHLNLDYIELPQRVLKPAELDELHPAMMYGKCGRLLVLSKE